MSKNIRRALEQHLATMSPALATAWENTSFVPTDGVPYQRAFMLPAPPDNSMLGPREWIEIGVFQVTLLYPQGEGSASAQARAEAVRVHFKRGTTLAHGGTSVLIPGTPAKAPAFISENRYAVPVSIRYQACIAT